MPLIRTGAWLPRPNVRISAGVAGSRSYDSMPLSNHRVDIQEYFLLRALLNAKSIDSQAVRVAPVTDFA
jgi:hypothetical protein